MQVNANQVLYLLTREIVISFTYNNSLAFNVSLHL